MTKTGLQLSARGFLIIVTLRSHEFSDHDSESVTAILYTELHDPFCTKPHYTPQVCHPYVLSLPTTKTKKL